MHSWHLFDGSAFCAALSLLSSPAAFDQRPPTSVLIVNQSNSYQSRTYVLAQVGPQLLQVANRPILVSIKTDFGTGAVGGYLLSPTKVGAETANLGPRTPNGGIAAVIPIAMGNSMRPILDSRQLTRRGLSEDRLPQGSEIRLRQPWFWYQYSWELIAVGAAVLLQSAVFIRLLIERKRRQAAEVEARRRILQVVHLNRTATAGALSTAIAHELNQPLGAILNYVATAEALLDETPLNVPLLKEIIEDVRRDNERASDVIKHLRLLFKHRAMADLQAFDLREVIDSTVRIVAPEAKRRGIVVTIDHGDHPLPVCADRVQLQQVLLNLLGNGMDAVLPSPPGRRRLSVHAVRNDHAEAEVLVADSGPGFLEKNLKTIFENFYTTKPGGTGLGLSIARTIVETHGGEIWAENGKNGGAVFRFTIPLRNDEPGGGHQPGNGHASAVAADHGIAAVRAGDSAASMSVNFTPMRRRERSARQGVQQS